MGLLNTDSIPKGISLREAYTRIRSWYRDNWRLMEDREGTGWRKSRALARSLPSYDTLSELEIRAVFGEVLYGYMEWAYHQSDGRFKMAAYAEGALRAAGLQRGLSQDEIQALAESRLWPLLILSQAPAIGSYDWPHN